jgi:hypothetical protein
MNWVFTGTRLLPNSVGCFVCWRKIRLSVPIPDLLKSADHVKFHDNQCKSIAATSAQYVILEKYFSHPSLVIPFFGTPLMRLILSDWK